MKARYQSGFTLLEMIVGIAIMGLAIVALGGYLSDDAKRSQETMAASELRQLVDATERYVADNNAALLGIATASTPATLTVATLQSAHYLTPQFPTQNIYRQTYEIRILEPSAGVLSTLIVTTGGDTVDEGSLRRIARQIGAAGGYVSTGSSTQARGAFGGWSQTLSTYGAANGGGRLAASLFFRDGQQVTDFLYRAALAGHPEANSMAAPLDMGNNNITNAGSVTASGAVSAGSLTTSGRVEAGEFISLGTAVTVGTACSQIGLLGREADGRLASCVSGTWQRAGF